jgi:serine/threonine protein kinase
MPVFTPIERLGTFLASRYRIEHILAVGGMGVVFAAHDAEASRAVAVKVRRAQDLPDLTRGARFLQEARLLAGLRHPHVVEILDFGEDEGGSPYLVMELLNGETLESLLARRRTLTAEESLELLLPVLGALARVHEAGVVHRDVKPDNIFLARGSAGEVVPKLLDFGIAKVQGSTIETRDGAVVGTPEYMAPEQLAGHEPTPATDVWAAAALFYRCATGKAPYSGAHSSEVLARLSHEAPPRLDAPGLSAGYRAAVERALSRDAAHRYASTREFAAALVLTAREDGLKVSDELLASAGLTALDLATRYPGARTVSSASIPRPGPRSFRHWAVAVLVFSSFAIGWVAVRHAQGARSEPGAVRATDASVPYRPVANASPQGTRDAPLPAENRPAAPEAPLEGATSPPSTRGSPRRRPVVAPARPVPLASPSPAPAKAAPEPRDDLPVVTEW